MPEAGTSTVSHASTTSTGANPHSGFTTTNTRTNKVESGTSSFPNTDGPPQGAPIGKKDMKRPPVPQTSGNRWNGVVRIQRWFRHWRSGRRSMRLRCILQVLLGTNEQNEIFSPALLQRADTHLKKDPKGVAWAALQSLLQVAEQFDYALRQENETRFIMVMELEKSNPSWRQATPATKRILRQSHPALRYCAVLSPDLFRNHVLKELSTLFESYLHDVEEEWEQVVEEQTLAQESSRRGQEMVREMKSLMTETLLPRYTDYLITRFGQLSPQFLSSCSRSRTLLLKAFAMLEDHQKDISRSTTVGDNVKMNSVHKETNPTALAETVKPSAAVKREAEAPMTTKVGKAVVTSTTEEKEDVPGVHPSDLRPLPMSEYSTPPKSSSTSSNAGLSSAALTTISRTELSSHAVDVPMDRANKPLLAEAVDDKHDGDKDGEDGEDEDEDEDEDFLFDERDKDLYSNKAYFAQQKQHQKEVRDRIEHQLQYSSQKRQKKGGTEDHSPDGVYTNHQLSEGIERFGELEDGLQLLGFRRAGNSQTRVSSNWSDIKPSETHASTLLSEVQHWSSGLPQPDDDDGDVDTFMTTLGNKKKSSGVQYRCAVCELTGILHNDSTLQHTSASGEQGEEDLMVRCHSCNRPVHIGCAADESSDAAKSGMRCVYCSSSCAAGKSKTVLNNIV